LDVFTGNLSTTAIFRQSLIEEVSIMAKLPANYKWLSNEFPEVMQAHQQMGMVLTNAGPLDKKTGQFIKLAAAAANRSEGAVHSHVKRAIEEGATPEEIYHVLLLLVSTVGFPTIAAALSWAKETIEQGS